MNRTACAIASLLAVAACNDPTNIGEQETDGTSGTGELGSTSANVDPPGSGTAATTDNPSASSQSSEPTTSTTDDSASTTGDTSGEESSSSETGQIDPPDGSNVVFLNFGGATMTAGFDNAPMNISSIGLVGELEPFQNPGDVPAIVSAVEAAWVGINVVFVSERPAEGDYSMVMITPTNPISKGVQGLGPLDCDNANPNSVAAVFTNVSQDPERIEVIISRELGFAYGLEPTDDDADFMNGNQVLGTEFVDGCRPLSMAGGCPHIGCPAGEQDSFGELVARLAAD